MTLHQTLMTKLIIVIGLPGSGKTHYLDELKTQKKIVGYYDDYQKKSYGNYRCPVMSRHYGPLLKGGKSMAISDIIYTNEDDLDSVVISVTRELPEVSVELHYFENNPNKAIINITERAREKYVEKEIAFVKENSPGYIVPKIKKLKIYSKKSSDKDSTPGK
jgi:hypothetical protein